jgi:hypothetical protein
LLLPFQSCHNTPGGSLNSRGGRHEENRVRNFGVKFVIATAANSDTLRLRSGATIEGTFLGADTRQIEFLGPDGQPKTYSLTEVEGITFAAMSAPAAAASKTPALSLREKGPR